MVSEPNGETMMQKHECKCGSVQFIEIMSFNAASPARHIGTAESHMIKCSRSDCNMYWAWNFTLGAWQSINGKIDQAYYVENFTRKKSSYDGNRT